MHIVYVNDKAPLVDLGTFLIYFLIWWINYGEFSWNWDPDAILCAVNLPGPVLWWDGCRMPIASGGSLQEYKNHDNLNTAHHYYLEIHNRVPTGQLNASHRGHYKIVTSSLQQNRPVVDHYKSVRCVIVINNEAFKTNLSSSENLI